MEGLGGREKIITHLLDFGKSTGKEISKRMYVPYRLVLSELHKVEKEGLVRREFVPKDGFDGCIQSWYALTEVGRTEALRVAAIVESWKP